MNEAYKALGVSENVLAFSETILSDLKDRFAAIDAIAEANQLKVIAAMQKNRVAANHFNLSTGYGYDDEGRDTLERVYADCFGAEAALVRPQITCGTHALALALGANLLPGGRTFESGGGAVRHTGRSHRHSGVGGLTEGIRGKLSSSRFIAGRVV